MSPPATKTARFAAVVKACGAPEPAELWRKPEQDQRFMAAVRQNRLLTVKQENVGAKKDFGVVGFLKEKNVSYLIFPKPLNAFAHRRIVGIRYNLLKAPRPLGPIVKPSTPLPRPIRRSLKTVNRFASRALVRPAELPRKAKLFQVTIRFNATTDVSTRIEADSKKAAAANCLRAVKTPDFSRATITRKIIRISRAQ